MILDNYNITGRCSSAWLGKEAGALSFPFHTKPAVAHQLDQVERFFALFTGSG